MISSYMTFTSWVRLFIVILIFLASPSWASAIPQFTLSDDIESQSLPTLHWADTSQLATPVQAKAALVSGELIAAGFTVPQQNASHWFAVTLINPTNHTVNPSIHLKQAFPHIVNIHYEQQLTGQPQAKWVSLLNGTNVPLHQRLVWAISPTFNLSLPAHQEQTYYLEIHSKVKVQRIDIKVGNSSHSSHFDLLHITVVKLFIGTALLLSLVSMLMYFSLRDSLYLYYCSFTLCLVPMAIIDSSLDLFFELPITDRSILYLVYNFLIVFFSLFVGKVLDVKRALPWFNVVLKVAHVVTVILAGLTLYDFNFFTFTLIFALLLSVFVFGVAIYAALVGDFSAQLLAIGIAAFVSGVTILRLMTFGLLPSNFFTDHGPIIGSFIELVLFLVVLFRKVISLNEDKHAANLALLNLSHEAKAVLEKTVHERTRELQQANRARGEFLATINHEMRTPLNGILGMVEMLQRKPSAIQQEEQLYHLGAASRQLSGLVNEVLDFSKIDENLIVIHAEDFATHSLVEDLTGLFSLSAKQKGIALSLQVEGEVSERLHGDMPHIKRVLTNLIGNAVKFTEQGEVRLIIGSGQSSESQNEGLGEGQMTLVTFEVSDTGCGIEPAQLEHIFSPYYQIGGQSQASVLQATKVGNSGTGLGLAISEGLVKAMGGSIVVTSHLGKGSRFSFTLSLPAAITPHKEPSHLELKSLGWAQNCFAGINILLVEDSPINRHVMTTFIQETGAKVSICDTGSAAIGHFKDHGADLILMDYRLPDTNGLAATQSIRAYEHQIGSPRCPIIMHTADNRASVRDEAQSAGIDLLLSKPFTQAQLINIISKGLEISSSSSCPPLKLNTHPKLVPLLDEFLDLNLASIQLCRDSLVAGDVEALSNELHKCKGNAGLFGADELHQTVLSMEEELVAVPYDMDLISTLLTQAQKQLKGYRLRSKGLE